MKFNYALFKLLNSYFFRGFFGPFFTIVFPILMCLIMSNAFYDPRNPAKSILILSKLNAGILITGLLATGFFALPGTIVDFKNSTLIKRVGSTSITSSTFLFTILIYYSIWVIFGMFWLPVWFGIFVCFREGMNWSVAFPNTYWQCIPYILIAVFLTISFALFVVSVTKTFMAAMMITNTLYLPIMLLSGESIPKQLVDNSTILNTISYFLPTKYIVDPFFNVWDSGFKGLDASAFQTYLFPCIAIAFGIGFLVVTIRKFKWSE